MALGDAAPAGLLALASIATLSMIPDYEDFANAMVFSLLMCAAVVLRRVAPLIGLGVVTLAGLGLVLTVSLPLPAVLAGDGSFPRGGYWFMHRGPAWLGVRAGRGRPSRSMWAP